MDCCGTLATVTEPLGLLVLLGTGLTISLGHCTGMCGPLVTGFSLTQRDDAGSTCALIPRLLLYHLGRVTSYTLLGGMFGLLGSTVLLTSQGRIIQAGLSLFVGLGMLALAIGMVGWLPLSRRVESGRFAQIVGNQIKVLLAAGSWFHRFLLGVANGFLPCGPVVAVALNSAATGTAAKGAASMAVFGLGTVPILLALGLGVGRLSLTRRTFFNRLAAGLVVLVAFQLLARGLATAGVIGHLRWGAFVVF